MDNCSDLHISRENSSLRQQVTDRLREAILDGVFKPGQKLVERDLCEMLGISRTVLRESLQHLKAEELITNIPHKGPAVARITQVEARDIYAVRQALEALAGEGFALNASDAQIRQIKAAYRKLQKISAGNSRGTLLETKNEFYRILLAGCGNAVVGQMLTTLNNRVTILRRTSLAAPGRLSETLKELDAIVAAIEARDAPLVRKLCSEHVANAAAVAMQNLDA